MAMKAAHGPEAGQIDQIYAIVFTQFRQIAVPDAGGFGEAMHHDQRFSLTRDLVAHRYSPHLYRFSLNRYTLHAFPTLAAHLLS